MSGVRGVGMQAYSFISPRDCPVCQKKILNFEQHTRTRLPFTEQDRKHIKLRILHNQQYNECLDEFTHQPSFVPSMLSDSGIATAINQKAWDKAIEIYRVEEGAQ